MADSTTNSSSHFQKTVCLDDWWLTKSENEIDGRRLAIAGYTSREQQAVRVFSSAPILKRYDVFTLETTDGVCVMIKGFLNKARTEENGFSSEVFSHFLFGFPHHWEECAEKFLVKECATKDVSGVGASMTEVSQVGIEEMNTGVQDCDNRVLEDRQHNPAYNDKNELTADNARLSNVINGVTEKAVEGPITPDLPVNSLDDIVTQPKELSGEIARHSMGRMINRLLSCSKRRQKDGQPTANLVENETHEHTSTSFDGSGQAKRAAQVESRLRNISIRLNAEPQEPVDDIIVQSSDVWCWKEIPEKTMGISASVAGPELKKSKTVRYSARIHCAENKDCKKMAAAEKESTPKEANTAGKKTRRKLTYGSPVTPRGEETASFFSPECLSLKRSRSGRLLVPTLEYWRNQTAVYDVDRRITGIKEGLNMPSRGTKSEPQRKGKKRTRI